MHAISLLMLLGVWLFAWREGARWVRARGVIEPISTAALGCILPTATLIVSIHATAMVSLLPGVAWVLPESVLVVFLALTALSRRYIASLGQTPNAVLTSPFRELRRVSRCGGLWIPVALVGAVYVVFLVDALTRYPTGYDAQAYHLPMAVTWMQSQRLDLFLGAIHECFPDNGMLVPTLLAFAKLERLFPLVHLPKGILVAAVVFGLIRATRFRRRTALLGACVALSVPMVLFQSFSSYIDLYAAAAWLSALLAMAWAVRAADSAARRDLVIMAGLAAGVALGGKTTYLLLVPMLGVVVILVNRLGRRIDGGTPSTALRHAVLFVVAAMACSAFWFVRGAVQAGNPVYPLEVSVGDHVLLPGYAAEMWFPERTFAETVERWWNYPWLETKYSGTGYPFGVNNGLGAAYAAFVPLGVLFGIASWFRRRPPMPANRLRVIMTMLAISGAVLVVTLFEEMLRFVLPLVIVGVVASAELIERLLTRWRRPAIGLVSIALACTSAIAVLKPAHALAGRIKDGVWDRAAFYEIPREVDELPSGSRLLNLTADNRNYALMGRRWANHVISPARWLATYHAAPLTGEMLREQGVDYVYASVVPSMDWVTALPLEFVGDPTAHAFIDGPARAKLYRVIDSEGDRRLASHLTERVSNLDP